MDTLEKYCKKLKLGSEILEEYESISLGDKKDFLTNVLEISINSQDTRRKNRLIAEAKFDVVKTFEGYCFDDIQLPEGLNLEEIKTGNFIEKSHNLIFYGSVGTGKTYLTTAIGVEACNQGKRVKFFKVATLINELIDAYNKATLGRFLKNLKKYDLIILKVLQCCSKYTLFLISVKTLNQYLKLSLAPTQSPRTSFAPSIFTPIAT